VRFVKNDIRYVGEMNGIYNYQPHHPNKILRQKFGDCKDKSLLLCKLFSIAGFQAYPVLVSNAKRATVGDFLPMNQAFDHCIVKAIYGNKATYIDPTINNQGDIFAHMYTPNFGLGLVLLDNSTKLQIIPPSLNSQINIREEFEINSFDIPGRLFTEFKFSGYEADYYRNVFNSLSKQDLNKSFTHFYAEAYPGYTLVTEPVISDNLYDNLLYVTMNATVDSFFKSYDKEDTNRLKFEIAPLQIISSIPTIKDVKRTMPIGIDHPTRVEYYIHVLLPSTFDITPDKMTILNEYFNYSSNVESNENNLHLTYNYFTLKNHVPADNSTVFLEDLEKMRGNLGYTLYYNFGSSQNSSKSEIHVVRILIFCIAILISAILVYFLHKYDPKPTSNLSLPLSNTMVGFWILLIIGWLYQVINLFFGADYFSLAVDKNLLTYPYGEKLSILVTIELVIETFESLLNLFIIIWFYKRRTSIPAIVSANYLFLLFW
ncbi:MAG: hypothetical protein K2Q22_09040, partial [Cytophagales bacterium]|nr:hypothetical protein [Cytophagales bacterium]